jgi:PAS domain S-box-containing protein
LSEPLFEEMKRYVRFGPADEAALRRLLPHARPEFTRITDDFYARLAEHDGARAVFRGDPDQVMAQVTRLKGTLCSWLELLLAGPWDDAYLERRLAIGRMHVRIELPQRYMFGAMNLIRIDLQEIAARAFAADPPAQQAAAFAVARVIDLELAIMLESYREAFVEKVQTIERLEKAGLEHRLRLSEERYEEIVDKGWTLVTTFDEDLRVLLFNPRCEELTGLTQVQAIGASWLDVFVPEEDRPRVRELCERVLLGQRVAYYEGRPPRSRAGERRVRWHLTTLPSGAGRVVCGMGLDVTEEHDLGVRTRRAERLAALGTMAAGLAHEIRNPLNAAQLQLTVAMRRLGRATGPEASGARESAELVAGELKRLGRIVEEFLQFARPQPLRLAEGGLHHTAADVLSLLAPEAAAAGVELSVSPSDPVLAEFDDQRIRQVLINLVRNAIEATGHGGHVRVGVSQDADGAIMEVEDDGPGIASDDAPIFEPFYTTKEGGTGLGLAIVHRIVSDHGGKVQVESRPGRTCFTMKLPGRLPARR